MTPSLICHTCGVEITLSDDTRVRSAEIASFCADHHEGGLMVETVFRTGDKEIGSGG